jgi:hypothetical protein
LQTTENTTAKLDGLMTCGYGIGAIGAARENQRCGTNICFSGRKGSVGGWKVMISRRRQRSSTAHRLKDCSALRNESSVSDGPPSDESSASALSDRPFKLIIAA